MQTARTEFSQALKAVAQERGLDANVIIDTIKQAIIAAYRRDAKENGVDVDAFDYEAVIDPVNGETRVFAWDLPAEDATDEDRAKAKKGKKDVTPPGFGRIAAQTAKQVIHQKIREAEKGAIMEEFEEKVGLLVSGLILRFDGPNVRIDLGRTEAVMLTEDRIPNERLSLNQRLTFLIKSITDTPRGREILLSRADPDFVKKLFEREVPEVNSKSVEIKAIAREAGVRTKIAVHSSQSGVDPVGSCVGQKGVRVQAVTTEIGGERVDVIAWSDDTSELIKSSLSPADNLTVTLDTATKIAKVSAPEDQLSMAIGKDGQNVRLTAKLTGYRIEVEGTGEYSPVEDPIEIVPEVKPVKINKTKAKKEAKKAKAIGAKKSEEVKSEEIVSSIEVEATPDFPTLTEENATPKSETEPVVEEFVSTENKDEPTDAEAVAGKELSEDLKSE